MVIFAFKKILSKRFSKQQISLMTNEKNGLRKQKQLTLNLRSSYSMTISVLPLHDFLLDVPLKITNYSFFHFFICPVCLNVEHLF